jgi:diketogulonate reductase-like aldo/keto reductase
VPAAPLPPRLSFPVVSFGLQVYDDGTATQLTTMALGVGFRNFFSSVLAGNQQGFGAAIKATSVPRSEIFICGSVNTGSGACSGTADCKTQTAAGCQTNLQDIGVDYLDMSEFVSSVRPRSLRPVARALAAAPCLPTCSPFYRVTGTCSSAPFLAPLHSHAGLPRR